MKVAAASVVLLITCTVFGNSISPLKLKKTRDLDGSLVLQKRARSWECTYDGETYQKGTFLNITSKGECYLYKCKGQKFRKVRKAEIIQYCDEPCEMGWLPGCCMCKRKSCEERRKAGETWMQVKKLTGRNKGICSRCECGADGNEYCEDSRFVCLKIPGCQETEKEPMPDSCCPKCKIWEKSTIATTQPIVIKLTTEGTTDPYPFTFPPGFDSSEDENR